jgi:hypothetical protein
MINKFNAKFFLIFFLIFLTNCGIYKPTDARKISPNPEDRVKKNLEEGKGLRLGSLVGKGNTNFQFSSSNPMWRASLEMLDFTPLVNADYSGGIIITDWFNLDEDIDNDISYKITVRFLSNEIRSDGLEILTYQKICNQNNSCLTKKFDDSLNRKISTKILKRATQISKNDLEKQVEENPYPSDILKSKN